MTKRLLLSTALLALLFAAGCGGGSDTPSAQTPGQPAAALPANLFVDVAPEGARDVTAVKADAKEGDVVVVRGKVGGSKEPFVAGRAAMMLGSTETIESCESRENDGCKTPWDYCCMTREALTAGTLTVQVVGPDGRPLKTSLQGAHGVDHLTVVVVKGKVGPRPDAGVLVVDAEAIYVEP